MDGRFDIRATGLRAHESVTLWLTESAYPRGRLLAEREFRASGSGELNLVNSALLSQGRPVAGAPMCAEPRLSRDIRVLLTGRGTTIASTRASRYAVPDTLEFIDERPAKTGFYGEYFRPKSTRSHTAILLIGGSEGGLANNFAAGLLAARGYPVLALAYFGEPGLPSKLERIPLEYFERALRWLANRLEVDAKKIILAGASFGGQGALLIAATYPQLVRGVAAYVPSAQVTGGPVKFTSKERRKPAWTLGGKAVPVGPIAVEAIEGPLFLVGAAEDHLWPSSDALIDIARRLRAHGKSDFSSLDYAHAGHGVGVMVPNFPTQPICESSYGVLDMGGRPAADESARRDSWPKLLRFLARI